MPTISAKTAKTAGVTVLVGVAMLTLAACGGSAQGADTPSSPSAPSRAGAPRFPGANGLIASVSGSTVQVQSQTAQTAVTFGGSTQITTTKSVALASVKVGDCVSANGSDASGSLTATTIRISEPVNGECATGGPQGGLPGRPQGGTAPSGFPGGGTPPSGAPGGQGPGAGAGFSLASGKVTGISASGLALSGQLRTMGSGTSPSPSQGSVTVVAKSDTTVTKEVAATRSALVVGQCARAIGEADAKGTIAATSINVSAPVDGSCQTGFRGGQR